MDDLYNGRLNNRDIKRNKKEQQYFNEKKENLNDYNGNNNDINYGPKDSVSNKNKIINNNLGENNNINDYINEILIKKETKLITDSKYISFENNIGENSCYVNVIIHLIYKFPYVNDFLIRKFKEKINEENMNKETINKENENIVEKSTRQK